MTTSALPQLTSPPLPLFPTSTSFTPLRLGPTPPLLHRSVNSPPSSLGLRRRLAVTDVLLLCRTRLSTSDCGLLPAIRRPPPPPTNASTAVSSTGGRTRSAAAPAAASSTPSPARDLEAIEKLSTCSSPAVSADNRRRFFRLSTPLQFICFFLEKRRDRHLKIYAIDINANNLNNVDSV